MTGQLQRQLPPSNLSLCFQGIKCAQGTSWLRWSSSSCLPPSSGPFDSNCWRSPGLRLEYIWGSLQPQPPKICAVPHLSCPSPGARWGRSVSSRPVPPTKSFLSLSQLLQSYRRKTEFYPAQLLMDPLIQALWSDIRG